METEENLYIKILRWTYSKKEDGFTWEELKEKFDLNGYKEEWIRKIFLTTSDADRKFFEHLRYDNELNKHYYSLNEKGMSAFIDYLELKEARESSRVAIYIAIGSLVIAIIVGIAQILVQKGLL